MNRRTLLLGASALGLAAFAGGTYVLNQRRAVEAEAVAAATPAAEADLLIRAHSPVLGPADAKVTLVEFFDPSCEACRAFHPVVKEIRKQFPTQVRVVMRYTVFHEGSDEAVRILEVARMQDKFEQVLDAILEKQPTWALHEGPDMAVAWRVAGAVGLDLKKSETERLFPGIVGVLNQDAADVKALGINSTPTFFLNGKRLEDVSLESLVANVKLAVENS
jgi:protein-disulfide isomerase